MTWSQTLGDGCYRTARGDMQDDCASASASRHRCETAAAEDGTLDRYAGSSTTASTADCGCFPSIQQQKGGLPAVAPQLQPALDVLRSFPRPLFHPDQPATRFIGAVAEKAASQPRSPGRSARTVRSGDRPRAALLLQAFFCAAPRDERGRTKYVGEESLGKVRRPPGVVALQRGREHGQ
jgi:hypothetical protein